MKTFIKLFFLLAATTLLFTQGCVQDKCKLNRTYFQYTPVYMSYEEFRGAFANEAPRDLENPGKLYFKGNYIFVSEINRGIHVIDNTDPANPVNINFINVPGNRDIAAKGNTLYADSHLDLLAIDISDPTNARITRRIEDIFPYMQWYNGYWADPALGVVSEWVGTEITEELDCDQAGGWGGWGVPWLEDFVVVNDLSTLGGGGGGGNGLSVNNLQSGVGGSMARFALYDNYLYTVTEQDLKLFNISTLSEPVHQLDVAIGWGIETIFPYTDKLFIGSQTGMFIYDLSNPMSPNYLSQFAHVTSCDPVVVQGERAYVTLRGGTQCNGFTNQLDVLNIANLLNPVLIKSYPMEGPYGLGIDDNTLFICDGDAGLKVFDATDDLKIDQNQLAHFKDINAFDVIPLNGLLLMIGSDGLYQYDYVDAENINLVSKIPVVK
jgi:hypothetical protein